MQFLSYDSPFMNRLRRLVDHMLLGILWVLSSLPVITFGASTTAMFFTAENGIMKETGKVFSTFRKQFIRDFKQATLLWIIEIVILILLLWEYWLMTAVELPRFLVIAIAIAFLSVFCWIQLWFGYLSKFEDSNKVLLMNTFKMMIVDFPLTLILGLLSVAAMVAIYVCFLLMPPFVLLIPGIYQILTRIVLRNIFKKYQSNNTEQDLLKT